MMKDFCSFPIAELQNSLYLSSLFGFSDIEILSHGKPVKPQIDSAIHLFASSLVAKRAKIASKRLGYLLEKGSDKGVSLGHIASHCGFDSDLLQQLANGDINMIQQHKEKISDTISSTLEKCVPSPERPKSGDTPFNALRDEISVFVDLYLQLLNLAYLDIPRLQGLPPSAFVHEKRVYDEATKDVYIAPAARLVRAIKRTMEQEEHDRYVIDVASMSER